MSLLVDDNGVPYIQLGSYRIKLEGEALTQDQIAKAEKELRETPENIQKALKEMRDYLKGEPDLNVPVDDDEFLMKFLRPCKFYADSSFVKMKKFYTLKRKNPEYCYGLLPSHERNIFSQNLICLQEIRDQNGSRIVLIHAGAKWKTAKCSLKEIFRGVQLALEAAMVEPKTQVGGVVVILDMKGFSLNHVMQFTPSFAKMVVDWVQECIPVRLKAVHIVNQPYVFNMVFAIFKPFLHEKIRNRIHFHGEDRDSLQKFIPKEALLPEYGGTMDMPDFPGSLFCDLLCKYESDFALADSFGYTRKNSAT